MLLETHALHLKEIKKLQISATGQLAEIILKQSAPAGSIEKIMNCEQTKKMATWPNYLVILRISVCSM
jgi:hypothetical protein